MNYIHAKKKSILSIASLFIFFVIIFGLVHAFFFAPAYQGELTLFVVTNDCKNKYYKDIRGLERKMEYKFDYKKGKRKALKRDLKALQTKQRKDCNDVPDVIIPSELSSKVN